MCRILGLSRQSYYYPSTKKDESELEEVVAEEFIRSRKAYGSRKIKKSLIKTRHSDQPTKKISRIMKNRGLKSSYTVAYFKVHHSTCNEANDKRIES
ncbi:hypothetical protein EfmAA55_32200 (plasmid) [Enterococcus faecium]|nr:hypothetical protein EfmAA55_32200 [Enterococcus faecium]